MKFSHAVATGRSVGASVIGGAVHVAANLGHPVLVRGNYGNGDLTIRINGGLLGIKHIHIREPGDGTVF